jgi:hypothetical protein
MPYLLRLSVVEYEVHRNRQIHRTTPTAGHPTANLEAITCTIKKWTQKQKKKIIPPRYRARR